jgi:hypothetical protein
MFIDWHLTLKISASSFYPGRNIPSTTFVNNHPHIHFDFAREDGPISGLYGNDSDIETEAEWFDEPQVGTVNPSKMSDAMGIEVCSF